MYGLVVFHGAGVYTVEDHLSITTGLYCDT